MHTDVWRAQGHFLIFLLKTQQLILITRRYQRNPNCGTVHEIIGTLMTLGQLVKIKESEGYRASLLDL